MNATNIEHSGECNECASLEAEIARYKATLKELRKPVRHHLEAMGAFFEIEEKKIEFYCKQLELSGKI
jgi:hypothetical protein